MKLCSKCDVVKPMDEFYNSKNAKDGKTSSCKACSYDPLDKARAFAYAEACRLADPVAALLKGAKARAKRDGIPFDITSKDIKKPARCPALGISLNYNGTGRGYGAKDDAASLDRIRSEKGYVRGNVQVVSWKANRSKSRLSPEELVRMAKFYSKFL